MPPKKNSISSRSIHKVIQPKLADLAPEIPLPQAISAPPQSEPRLDRLKSWLRRSRQMRILILFLFVAVTIYKLTWPSQWGLYESRFYTLLAKGFLQGHTSLALTPPPELIAAFENGYQYDVIIHYPGNNIPWDSLVYQGKVYIYQGPVPALICSIWGLLGDVDSCADTNLGLYAGIGVLFWLYLILDAIGSLYSVGSYHKIMWYTLILFAFGGLHMYAMGNLYAGVYTPSIVIGVFFLLGGVFFFLHYIKSYKLLDILFMNVFFALAIGTRITVALYIICFAIAVLFNERKKREDFQKILRLLLTFTPILLVGILLLLYNKVRFNNYLEFGMKYIYTTPEQRDIIHNGGLYSILNIKRNLYDYFLRLPVFSLEKPYIILNYEGYRYFTISVFFLAPVTVLTFLLFPYGEDIVKKETRIFLIPIIISTAASIIHYMMWFGSVLRYTYEFAPFLFIIVYVILMYIYNQIRGRIILQLAYMSILGCIGAISLIVGWLMLMNYVWQTGG